MQKSIDLTRLPLPPAKASASSPSIGAAGSPNSSARLSPAPLEERLEYSTREVKPATLLLRDLLRAHSLFLLHHDSSLSALFVRVQRQKFVSLLTRYWDLYLSTWNVLLHGNPACNIFGGIKIAACGELGMGVGEEERGSGEREVLEGMVGRVEGLVDLVVGKFGEHVETQTEEDRDATGGDDASTEKQWLGTGSEVGAEDGAIFLGVGALSRQSVRSVAYFMEDMYTWGENAYGVHDSPTATRVRPRPSNRSKKHGGSGSTSKMVVETASGTVETLPTIPSVTVESPTSETGPEMGKKQEEVRSPGPPPPVTARHAKKNKGKDKANTGDMEQSSSPAGDGGMDTLFSYLKLGYGTSWSLGGGSSGLVAQPDAASPPQESQAKGSASKSRKTPKSGHFLIGLMGDIEEIIAAENSADPTVMGQQDGVDSPPDADLNTRIPVRTLTVELEGDGGGMERRESQVTRDLGSGDTEVGSPPAHHSSPSVSSGQQTVTPMQLAVARNHSSIGSSKGSSKKARPMSRLGTSSPTGTETTTASRATTTAGTMSTTNTGAGTRSGGATPGAQDQFDSQDRNKTQKLRVVVYVNQPFIFVFLFQLRTDSLAFGGLYKSLHQQLRPLGKMLVRAISYRPERPGLDEPSSTGEGAVGGKSSDIFDLVWDPRMLTLHSTIPNIPDPVPFGGAIAEKGGGKESPWSRMEALNTHNQILNIFGSTRFGEDAGVNNGVSGAGFVERTCKTSRGWWIVWSRVLENTGASSYGGGGGSASGSVMGGSCNWSDGGRGPSGLSRRWSDDDSAESGSPGGGGGGARRIYVAGGGGEQQKQAGDDANQQEEDGGEGHGEAEGEDHPHTPKPGGSPQQRPVYQRDVVVSKEIFLIRRSSEHIASLRGASGSYGITSVSGGAIGAALGGGGGNNGGWADGASRLAQGIGVDTRRYIEGLLSLNR